MNKEDFDLEVERLEKSKRLCMSCGKLFFPEDLTEFLASTDEHEELEVQLCDSCKNSLSLSPPEGKCLTPDCSIVKTEKITMEDFGEPPIKIEAQICRSCFDNVLERNGYELCEECETYAKGLTYIRTHGATREDPEEGIHICGSCKEKKEGYGYHD